MKKVSIIVPVYNCRRTLKRCVDSLLLQSYPDIEIILVDDGSTDGSSELCDMFQQQNVIVIHSENYGVSSARNLGLRRASGDMIGFCDADDMFTRHMIRELVKRMEETEADVVTCSFYHTTEVALAAGEWIDYSRKTKDSVMTGRDFMVRILQDNSIGGFVWNKLFRRTCIEGRQFSQELQVCEDLYFIAGILSDDIKVACIEAPLYQYIFSDSSVTQNNDRLFSADGRLKFWNAYQKILTLPITEDNEIRCLLCSNLVFESMGKFYRYVKQENVMDRTRLFYMRAVICEYFGYFIKSKYPSVKKKITVFLKYILAEVICQIKWKG